MSFSLRRMLSNITYFKKPEEEDGTDNPETTAGRSGAYVPFDESKSIDFERIEPDSTSKPCATSLKLPDAVKTFVAKKGSLSDTDLLTINADAQIKKDKRKNKKLKLDIKKCSQSMGDSIDKPAPNVENTPKHVLLDSRSADVFSEHFRGLDFNHSFDIFEAMSDVSICDEENDDIESLSEHSETDISYDSDDSKEVKMCRKIESACREPDNQLVPSASPESFGDVEVDKNEEERMSLLLNYQMKLEKLDCVLKKLLTEFKFHIEVSKVFNCRSIVTMLPGTDVTNLPKLLGDVTYIDNTNHGPNKSDSWNIILEKEDDDTKNKIKTQLLSMKHCIDDFIQISLEKGRVKKCEKITGSNRRRITFDLKKGKRQKINIHFNNKKRIKHFDFPDIRDAMLSLFEPESTILVTNVTQRNTTYYDESDDTKCICSCHHHRTASTPNDSGLNIRNDVSSQSITSSIGNFSLDSSTLTAYSESLDLIVSYNSFQDSSLYSTLLQKAAIERITFYVQVHSIQLTCEQTEKEYESKNVITFFCPSCKTTEKEENNLLNHILSQSHCEKIHFVYKTAYIKKCVSAGKEIMPSTVLNPMTMYRDENKIVCFGDAMYACSLCFENLISGESVLMAHCSDPEHVQRRDKLCELLE